MLLSSLSEMHPRQARKGLILIASALVFLLSLGMILWYRQEIEGYEELARQRQQTAALSAMATVRDLFHTAHTALYLARDLAALAPSPEGLNADRRHNVSRAVQMRLGEGSLLLWHAMPPGLLSEDVALSPRLIEMRNGSMVWEQQAVLDHPGGRYRLTLQIPHGLVQDRLRPMVSSPQGILLLADSRLQSFSAIPGPNAETGGRGAQLLPLLAEKAEDRHFHLHLPTPYPNGDVMVTQAKAEDLPLRLYVLEPVSHVHQAWVQEGMILLILYAIGVITIISGAFRLHHLLQQMFAGRQALEETIQARTLSLQTEMRLGQSRESELSRMRQAVDAALSAVLLVTPQGVVTYANAAFQTLTGRDRQECLGQSVLSTFPPLPNTPHPIRDALEREEHRQNVLLYRHPDQHPRWLLVSVSPVRDGVGPSRYFVVIAEDVSAQHQQSEELRQMRDRAESANRTKNEFLSRMSHELRTPLNAILGFGQLLQGSGGTGLSERQGKYVDGIVYGGERLLTLVTEILDLAEMEAGRLLLSPGPVSLGGLVSQVLDSVAAQAADQSVQLVNLVRADSLPWVQADERRLLQVVHALVSNAVKYNRPHGQVQLEAVEMDPTHLRLLVSDTGIGIDRGRQKDLFQPFERLGADQRGIDGVGIGLTTARTLMEAMGGQLGFASEQDQGSVFWLDLPLATGGDAVREAETGPDRSADRPVDVLYVEDNSSNRELMAALLRHDSQTRWHLRMAIRAEDGLEMALQQPPDIIIMDVNLPGMSGIEAMAELRRHDSLRRIPVIGLSADVMPDTIRRGLAAGFVRYIQKPLKVKGFTAVLRSHVAVPGTDSRRI